MVNRYVLLFVLIVCLFALGSASAAGQSTPTPTSTVVVGTPTATPPGFRPWLGWYSGTKPQGQDVIYSELSPSCSALPCLLKTYSIGSGLSTRIEILPPAWVGTYVLRHEWGWTIPAFGSAQSCPAVPEIGVGQWWGQVDAAEELPGLLECREHQWPNAAQGSGGIIYTVTLATGIDSPPYTDSEYGYPSFPSHVLETWNDGGTADVEIWLESADDYHAGTPEPTVAPTATVVPTWAVTRWPSITPRPPVVIATPVGTAVCYRILPNINIGPVNVPVVNLDFEVDVPDLQICLQEWDLGLKIWDWDFSPLIYGFVVVGVFVVLYGLIKAGG